MSTHSPPTLLSHTCIRPHRDPGNVLSQLSPSGDYAQSQAVERFIKAPGKGRSFPKDVQTFPLAQREELGLLQ